MSVDAADDVEVIRIFVGFDYREAIGFHVFMQSLIEKSSLPISVVPVANVSGREGTNAFTFSRFLVPWLCGFRGYALWVDGSDMLLRDDPAELWRQRVGKYAVRVVKHDYRTEYAKKYVGTPMEAENRDYSRKNWSSVIFWDCANYRNRCLTPELVAEKSSSFLHGFGWLSDDWIGELDPGWNGLVLEQDCSRAKLLHFTLGLPHFEAYADCEGADEWRAVRDRITSKGAEKR